MVEHDVRVPTGDQPDRVGFVYGIDLVDITTQHLRRVIVKLDLFQFPGDELFQGFGLGRWDAPPVGKVFEVAGPDVPEDWRGRGLQGWSAGGWAGVANPLSRPGEVYFCALVGTTTEAA